MFEEYLKDIHAKEYMGTDDDMPESFERWLENLDNNDLMEYGNEAMIHSSARVLGSVKSDKKSISSKENGKKGGRPKLENK